MDLADQADLQNAAALEADIQRRREATGPVPLVTPAGVHLCLNCNDELPAGGRWCDQWCREDWQRIKEAEKRNGDR